jgi:hypothetical protein
VEYLSWHLNLTEIAALPARYGSVGVALLTDFRVFAHTVTIMPTLLHPQPRSEVIHTVIPSSSLTSTSTSAASSASSSSLAPSDQTSPSANLADASSIDEGGEVVSPLLEVILIPPQVNQPPADDPNPSPSPSSSLSPSSSSNLQSALSSSDSPLHLRVLVTRLSGAAASRALQAEYLAAHVRTLPVEPTLLLTDVVGSPSEPGLQPVRVRGGKNICHVDSN